MNTAEQVRDYLASLPEPRQSELRRLHGLILDLSPGSKLWFQDGKDETGKVVSNPSIGYGVLEKEYAGGKTRELFRVGISANSSGLSVYIMGLDDKGYLAATYGAHIGKAKVTGYCIKFTTLEKVNQETLMRAIHDGLQRARV